jgi:DNA-binding beta-propeller fold protein YncE
VIRRKPRPPRVSLWLLALICSALGFPAGASASQLYASDHASNTVSAFTLGASGLLSPIACSGESCENETDPEPAGLAISPNGQFLFVADRGGKGSVGSVSAFKVSAGGTLSENGCAKAKDCKTGSEPAGVATSPNGQFLYIANEQSNDLSAYSIGSEGKLSAIGCGEKGCATGPETKPFGVAVSTNGQFVYTTDLESNEVSAFRIGEHGGLAPIECPGCHTGESPTGIAVTPNGQFLFVANRASNTISAFKIEASGALSAIECEACKAESEPTGVAISPNGDALYTTDAHSNTVSMFQIEGDGQLSPIECMTTSCDTGTEPVGVAVSPNGQFLYAANVGSSTVSPFSIGLGGLLSPLSCVAPACSSGSGRSFNSLAISPDPGPTAEFTDTPAPAGSSSGFDGKASTAPPEESVARYDWSFGDGSSAQNAGPSPSHVYNAPGTYTVTLTVTDNLGCSDTPIFTGQTASCGGSSAAQKSEQIVVPVPTKLLSTLKLRPFTLSPLSSSRSETTPQPALTFAELVESAKSWREGSALAHITANKKKPPLGTTFSFFIGESNDLREPAIVTFTFTKPASGRRVGKGCVAPTKSNNGKRHCTRTVTAGTLKLSAGAGKDRLRFDGVISKHKKLTPASYTLLASARAFGRVSGTRILHFTILRGS